MKRHHTWARIPAWALRSLGPLSAVSEYGFSASLQSLGQQGHPSTLPATSALTYSCKKNKKKERKIRIAEQDKNIKFCGGGEGEAKYGKNTLKRELIRDEFILIHMLKRLDPRKSSEPFQISEFSHARPHLPSLSPLLPFPPSASFRPLPLPSPSPFPSPPH